MVYSAKWSFLFYDFFFFKIQKDLQFTPIKCSPAQHRLSSRKFPQKLEESTDQEMSSVNKFLVKKKKEGWEFTASQEKKIIFFGCSYWFWIGLYWIVNQNDTGLYIILCTILAYPAPQGGSELLHHLTADHQRIGKSIRLL